MKHLLLSLFFLIGLVNIDHDFKHLSGQQDHKDCGQCILQAVASVKLNKQPQEFVLAPKVILEIHSFVEKSISYQSQTNIFQFSRGPPTVSLIA